MARHIDVVIIGAGHCGLAMSYCLQQRSIQHVVLERGQVANAWRNDRWQSLRLLTPNWQCRLPGHHYDGDDPHGFMSMPEVVDFMTGYAESISAPVECETEVVAVEKVDDRYRVSTNRGQWHAKAVVLASGACSVPSIPKVSTLLPDDVLQLSGSDYKSVEQLPAGNVLVVGGSASGLQLADEIRRSGRQVTLSVGEHVRMPRTYRGRDIQHWLSETGLLDEHYEAVDDIRRARRTPSPQLVGRQDKATLDLNTLTDLGVKLAGRLVGCRADHLMFSGSLRNVCALADLKQNRLLNAIDAYIDDNGLDVDGPAAARPSATQVPEKAMLTLDLRSSGIETVIWATGFKPDYSWLKVPVLDRKGQLMHDGGIVAAPGLYAMGLPFMRRRKSSFIHGAADDASDLCAHLSQFLFGATDGCKLSNAA